MGLSHVSSVLDTVMRAGCGSLALIPARTFRGSGPRGARGNRRDPPSVAPA
ncbi:hypothetical protein KCH_17170 [Kitasatospora cheerisanensis KCTC 2395]|uniref:Uncharacterized protein n=1 Tax=Kitasatospora cheerisanensis KCTC 2395 TaxID=1348663 RepID=A0A066Z8I0_9ACTN|nr:hypothetical protein KCH_17170 [Kitasatospora cheerisanensis KCTC 2395]